MCEVVMEATQIGIRVAMKAGSGKIVSTTFRVRHHRRSMPIKSTIPT
jgi:hypothetical protein